MPYFGAKTSDFLGTNIRTFHAKPPYFVAKKSEVSGFQPGNGTKIPFQPILRYFRTGQGTKAFEALLDPLTTQYERLKAYENGRRKILHTPFDDPESLAFNDMESLPFSAGHWGVFCTFFTVETDKKRKKQGGMKVFFCTFAPIVTH